MLNCVILCASDTQTAGREMKQGEKNLDVSLTSSKLVQEETSSFLKVTYHQQQNLMYPTLHTTY